MEKFVALKMRKSGRPPGRPEVDSEQITLRLPSDLIAAIDRYRQRTLPIPNRQDVIREVMTEWAKNNS